ncbi:Mth938-like domain-containing protein [Zavarzinia sp. CC-PAN008]|uniref:Mth938-like domain-containing protein n=1 Tax=Zavarzinia sp. CC-PAN008 TaxID=3243332 RepID=UPI003F746E9F
MAQMVETRPGAPQVIQRYGAGAFTIGYVAWTGAVLVMPERTLALAATRLEDLDADQVLAGLAGLRVDVVLVGTGADFHLLPQAFRARAAQIGLPVEGMGTGAACRTYNVMLGENRSVAAALLPTP